MKTEQDLRALLTRIDHLGYPAYKDLTGAYQLGRFVLSIDHVQGDPFAAPSQLSVRLDAKEAAFPASLFRLPRQKRALEDTLTRRFGKLLEEVSFRVKGSGQSGRMGTCPCGPEIVERSSCHIDDKGNVVARLEAGFPAAGRTIQARGLERMLLEFLPRCVTDALCYDQWDKKTLQAVADLAQDQEAIRTQMAQQGLCAFVADGSILPRASGVSEQPMAGAVPFYAPESMAVKMTLPKGGVLRGMGIARGITLICGGGYHGKSTLLQAIEKGVYDHIAGDGREYVLTDETAMKIRAEDGRSVYKTDISLFIHDLPSGKDTRNFTTKDASGSTSEAANVVEAMEAGSRLLLLDEDTSATNFLVRDALMQRVICREMEPITPFLDRIEALYTQFGVSVVLVAGSSGAFFHPANHILQMDRYVPKDITAIAKKAAAAFPLQQTDLPSVKMPCFDRRPKAPALTGERVKIKPLGMDSLALGRETLDLRAVEQIISSEETAALGYCLRYAARHLMDGKRTVQQVVDALEEVLNQQTVAALGEGRAVPFLVRPRRQEIFAAIDRYRELTF